MKKLLITLICCCSIIFANAQDVENQPEPQPKTSFFGKALDKVEDWYGKNMNYTTVAALMAVESSCFIPFPSEVVIPPAAYIASSKDPEINKKNLNIYLVVLFGTIGAMIGAYINYFLARWLGRPILYKFADSRLGRFLTLSSKKIIKAEDYFNKHGNVSTLVGRLIPLIRQYISIPAGLAKMKLLPFSFYTFIGAGLWNCCLALIGYFAQENTDLIKEYSHIIGIGVICLVILVVIYFIVKKILNKKKRKNLETEQ